MNEREIFSKALQLDSEEERDSFLDSACENDTALRHRIEALLAQEGDLGSFLAAPIGIEATHDMVAATERPGDTIGPYKLLQQIGEGGMGVVYMAEQTEPVERRVALKIIKPGMDTRQVIARFEAERQALAMMDHPNIAKVLDAGTTGTGRPYFVMELVKGLPVTQYCDEQHLTPQERLELFLPICRAVQHAHQKGIIHRDLKPSNVLVARYDDSTVPKIIDFGIAKAVSQKLTEKTMFTQFGQIVGTIEYMSPEQAQFNQLDVDTRSDVYSLGVLLYELLTGETPFDKRRLRAAAFDELLRIIREEEPPLPSVKLSTSETLPSVAANRQIEPNRLSTLLRGDLDWIIMKSLEKDRRRRYGTPNELARDIERHLSDEAVEARPASAAYRFRKYVRRHKTAITTLCGFTMLLCVGTVVSVLLAVRATKAEAQAHQLYLGEQSARAAAEDANAIAQAVNEFLREDILGQANPFEENPPDLTVKQALDRAAESVGDKFEDQPLIEAAVRLTIGQAYKALGRFDEAEPQFERSLELRRRELGEGHVDTLTSANALTDLYDDQGRRNEAFEHYLRNYDLCREHLGDEHQQTLLASNNLAYWYLQNGKSRQAEKMFLEGLQLRERIYGEDDEELLPTLNNLAALYFQRGDYTNAEDYLERTLGIADVVWTENHPSRLKSMANLAVLRQAQGNLKDAAKLLDEVLEIQRVVLPENHPDRLTALNNLAVLTGELGDYAESERLHRELFEINIEFQGETDPQTLLSKANVAWLEGFRGRYEEAEKKYTEILETLDEMMLEQGHPQVLFIKDQLAGLYEIQGKFEPAEPLRLQILTGTELSPGPDSMPYAVAQMRYAENLLHQGRIDDCNRFVKLAQATVDSVNQAAALRFHLWSIQGALLTERGKFDEAEERLRDARDALMENDQTVQEQRLILAALERTVRLYDEWGKPEDAARWTDALNAAREAYGLPDP